MSTRLQHNMDKKAPAQRLSSLSPVALVVMGLVGAADALASLREALSHSQASAEGITSAKTTVMDYNAVASLVQALVREGVAPEEAALQVQFALQGPNPLAALSALVASVSAQAGAELTQDALSLTALVDALSQQVAQLTENGQSFDVAMLQDFAPQATGFAQADLAQALETFKALEQGVGASQRGGNADVAQNQIDMLLAQATQSGAAVATDAGAASTATASGAASGAAAAGALSAAQAIAMVAFAAVASDAIDGSSTTSTADSSSGNVVKGPITGATVFRDLNGNYILDSGESSATTTTGGAYTLSGSGGKIVATGGTDSTTNLAFTGMLAAPAGATVVTPLTTLLAANSSLTAADLKSALGLSVDPLSFNPFATGVNAADALKAEGAAAQVNTILTSLAVTVNGASGGTVSLADAVSAVANKLGAQVATQAAALKVSSSAGTLNLGSDALFTNLVSDVRTAVASKVTLSDSDFTSVVTSAKATNASIASVVSSNGSLTTIANTLKTAQGTAPAANASLLPDVTVAEDTALAGTGGAGALTTLPSTFTASNINSANLQKFFDSNSSTVGAAPTLTFDMTGYSVTDSGASTMDLIVSMQKAAFSGLDLSLTLNDVKLDAATANGNTTFTLPAQTISATVKMGSVSLGSFNVSNLDSDALTLAAGANTVGASPSFTVKLDSLFAKMSNGVGDVLDLTTLSNEALVALGGALVVGALDDVTPASVVGKLKEFITLPSSVDTVSELVKLAQDVVDFPQVSSLKIYDLLGQIPESDTKTLLLAAASRASVNVTSASSDTISSALTKFSTAFGTYKLSEITDLLANGLGLDQGVDLVSVTKELLVAALGLADGLTVEQILDKAIGALVDVNNGDLRALLAGIDYESILGTSIDVNVLNSIAQYGTVKYVDLINLGASTLLSTDATLTIQANDFKGLSVSANSAPQSSLQISVPIGSASTFTPPSSGLGVPTGAFTDADTADVLKYTATLESGAALPSWLTFNGLTKSFTGTPTNDHVGALNIKITAIDPAGNTASDVFKLTVTNVNDAPQLVSGATTTATAVEFAAASFDVAKAFKDIDAGDTLTYSAASGTTLPSGWTLSSAGVLSGTAPVNSTNSNATQTIKITATDKSSASVTQDFVLTVTNDTTAPANLTPTLVEDNGTNTTDFITGNGRISINSAALESGAKWFSSVKGEVTEQTGKTYFDLPVGSYTADEVKVYQQDQAGNNSLVQTTLGKALSVVAAPGAPTITFTDSAITTDGVTNVKSVSVTLTDSATTWAYSLKGASYVTGTGTSFNLVDGVTYAAGDIKVKQFNAAGISGSLEATNTAAVTVDQTAPTVAISVDSIDSNGVYTLKFAFSESVSNFVVGDVGLVGATAGTFSGSGSNYTLLATPNASTTGATMTASVAANVATDLAGNANTAATDLAKYVLYGTTSADTLTGSAFAELVYAKDGNDTISAGAGADTIFAGAGNDVITGGAGADAITLGDGVDTIKLAAASDSTASASDTVTGFAAGDKIDLSTLLGSAGVGYTGESSLPSGSANSVFVLKNQTVSGLTASVDIFYSGSTTYDVSGAEFSFFAPSIVSSYTVENGTSGLDFQTAVGEFKVVGVDVSPGTIAANTKLATVTFTLSSAQTQFVFAVTKAQIDGDSVNDGASGALADKDVPVPVIAGGTSSAITGLYTTKDDGSALTTVGDNEVHFANNATTGGVDVRYDTNKAAGTTVLSDIIHLDGITSLDLSKTDFIFV
jgi:hypothetical protein